MNRSLKTEFRKLLTVRSTYFILGFTLLLVAFFAFYINGWHIDKIDLLTHNTLANDVTDAITTVSIFSALVGVLLLTHEYRYNTILYTLTLSNSRSKVLMAKILVMSAFAVGFTVIFGALSPLLSLLGIHIHHLHLASQSIPYRSLIWHTLFYGWGYTMAGLVLACLIRNQVGTIIALFVAPGTIESLLGLLLKKNVVYLPFSALHQVVGHGLDVSTGSITPVHGVEVFGGYLVVTWIAAWILFLRRDAN